MIRGVHTMFYSSDADGLRSFLRDKLGFSFTDVGGGWLIFDLPEAEMGCHPADDRDGACRYARCVILLRRHRADRRRAEGPRRRVHRRRRRSRLRPRDAFQDARRRYRAALSAAICEARGEVAHMRWSRQASQPHVVQRLGAAETGE